jgi:hypothetical protein
MQSPIDLTLSRLITHPPILIDLFHIRSEYEHIVFSDFLSNFNISAIHRANNDRSIHNEFHVGGARGLGAGCRDMLGEVSCGDDNLGIGDAVVLQEDDLEEVVDRPVVVYYLAN